MEGTCRCKRRAMWNYMLTGKSAMNDKPIYRVSGFDLPAHSTSAKMLRAWKRAGGRYKNLFRFALHSYVESGTFERDLAEMNQDVAREWKEEK